MRNLFLAHGLEASMDTNSNDWATFSAEPCCNGDVAVQGPALELSRDPAESRALRAVVAVDAFVCRDCGRRLTVQILTPDETNPKNLHSLPGR